MPLPLKLFLKRWGLRAALAVVLALATLIVGGGCDARIRVPDLKPWHRVNLDDLKASDMGDDFTLAEYLAREDKLFAAIKQFESTIDAAERTPVNRYSAGSRSHPSSAGRDWNRTFEVKPDVVRGGALLIHGLTDSPYSMRATAEVLREDGVYSLALRMPGHGTVPSGLVRATWQDWLAAVRVGVRHVKASIPEGAPLIIVGYSNGGALALKYTLDALEQDRSIRPAKLILLSPMIGVTPAARLARWIGLLGVVPFFEKANWIDVVPEYNPFKYNSFPANAGLQTSLITRALYADLDRIHAGNLADRLPPILTFQSIVDSTVSAPAVMFSLYERLPKNGSELIVFDVNHMAGIDVFVQPSDLELGRRFLDPAPRNYRRVLITNATAETRDVEARVIEPGAGALTRLPLGLSWPADVFSLTHVAVPFRPDDPLYGYEAGPAWTLVNLGRLSPRGEKGVLTVASEVLMRLSSNPFFPVITEAMPRWLGAGPGS
jgi:alpha-beta hydrolase superfamily lysophospholipase